MPNKRLRFKVFIMTLILSLFVFGIAIAQATTTGSVATVRLDPSSSTLTPGQLVQLTVYVENIPSPGLTGAQVNLWYDTSLFTVEDTDGNTQNGVQIQPGSLLNPLISTFASNRSYLSGTIEYDQSLQAQRDDNQNLIPVTPVITPGTLATIKLRAKTTVPNGVVSSSVYFTLAKLSDANGGSLGDTNPAQNKPVIIQGAQITIANGPPPVTDFTITRNGSTNLLQPFKAGDVLGVSFRTQPGVDAYFLMKRQMNVIPISSAMQPDPQDPGLYRGEYTFLAGDDTRNMVVVGRAAIAGEETIAYFEPNVYPSAQGYEAILNTLKATVPNDGVQWQVYNYISMGDELALGYQPSGNPGPGFNDDFAHSYLGKQNYYNFAQTTASSVYLFQQYAANYSRLSTGNNLITISIGGNDLKIALMDYYENYLNSTASGTSFSTMVQTFSTNLNNALREIKANKGNRVYILNLFNPLPGGLGETWLEDKIYLLNTEIINAAVEHGATVVPVKTIFTGKEKAYVPQPQQTGFVSVDTVAPLLTNITHNGQLLGQGASLNVSVSTEPGSGVKFRIETSTGAVVYDNGNLQEDPNNPGNYSASLPVSSYAVTGGKLKVTATDAAGNSSSADATAPVNIDNQAPSIISLNYQPSGSPTNTSTVNISGQADADAVLVEYLIGEELVASETPVNGNFTTEVTLDEGNNPITVRVSDAAGNSRVSEVHNVVLDITKPDFTVTHNANASVPFKAGQTLTVTVTVNNVETNVTGNVYFSNFVLPLRAGQNANEYVATYVVQPGDNVNDAQVTAKLIDGAGNNETKAAANQVSIDTTAPMISSVAHNAINKPLKAGSQLTLVVNGDAGDNASVQIGGTTISVPLTPGAAPGQYQATYTIPSGINVTNAAVTGKLVDTAGNETVKNAVYPVTIDTTLPYITGPVSVSSVAYLKKDGVLTVSFTGEPDLSSATFNINGLSKTITMSQVSSGQYRGTYTVQANDNLNNASVTVNLTDAAENVYSQSAIGLVTFDTNAPVIVSTGHNAQRPLKEGETLIITVNGEKGNSGSVTVAGLAASPIALNEAVYGAVYSEYRAAYTVRAGDQLTGATVAATLQDQAGNITTRNVLPAVSFDTIVPVITSVTHNANSNTPLKAGDQLVINVAASNDEGLKDKFIKIGDSIQINLDKLSAGNYRATYTVVTGDNLVDQPVVATLADEAGNTATQTATARVAFDTQDPVIDRVTLNSTLLKAGQRLIVTVYGDPGNTGSIEIAGTTIDFSDLVYVTGREYSASYTVQSNDKVTNGVITAVLTDPAGNSSSLDAKVTVSFDTAAPVIKSVSFSPAGSLKAGEVVTVTVYGDADETATATIDGIDGVIALNQDQLTSGLYVGSYTVVAGNNITGKVNAHLVDDADNESTLATTNNIKFDTTIPVASGLDYTPAKHLRAGNTVNFTLTSEPGGEAYISVLDADNNAVISDIVLKDAGNGNYSGAYTVQPDDNVVDGTIRAVVNDAAGNISVPVTGANPITFDNNVNILSVTHSATGPLNAGDTLTVTMRLSEPEVGAHVYFDVGSAITLQPMSDSDNTGVYTGKYVVASDVNLPNAEVKAYITDLADNYAEKVATTEAGSLAPVTIDTTNPEVTVTSSAYAAKIFGSGETINVAITANEPGSQAKIDILYKGANNVDTIWKKDINLTYGAASGKYEGSYQVGSGDNIRNAWIVTRFTDLAGNVGTGQTGQVLNIDAVPPGILSAIHSAKGILVGGQSLKLTVFGEPGANATYRIDNIVGNMVEATLSGRPSGMYSATFAVPGYNQRPMNGASSVAVTLQDSALNTNTATLKPVSIDNIPPVINSVQVDPQQTYYKGNDRLRVVVNGEPGATGTVEIGSLDKLILSGNQGQYATAYWTVPSNMELKDLPVTVRLKDSVNNESVNSSIKIYIDSVPPVTNVSTDPEKPDGKGNYYRTEPKVTLTSEKGATIWAAVYQSATYISGGSVTDKAYELYLSDNQRVRYYAVDAAGNAESAKWLDTLRIDTVKPEKPVFDNGLNNSIVSTETTDVTGSVEPNATIEYYRGSAKLGSVATGSDGRFTLTVELLEGPNQIKAKTIDQADNESSEYAHLLIKKDTSPPVFTIEPKVTTSGGNKTVDLVVYSSETVKGTPTVDVTIVDPGNNTVIRTESKNNLLTRDDANPNKFTGTIVVNDVTGLLDIEVTGEDNNNNSGKSIYTELVVARFDGATINGEDYSIFIPANALEEDASISTQGTDEGSDKAAEKGMEVKKAKKFRPDGTKFASPVRITLHYADDVNPDKLVLLYWTGEEWIDLLASDDLNNTSVNRSVYSAKEIDYDNRTISFWTKHFSDYGMLADETPPADEIQSVMAGEKDLTAITNKSTNANSVRIKVYTGEVGSTVYADNLTYNQYSQEATTGINLYEWLQVSLGDGLNEIKVVTADKLGNRSLPQTVYVTKDQTAPDFQALLANVAGQVYQRGANYYRTNLAKVNLSVTTEAYATVEAKVYNGNYALIGTGNLTSGIDLPAADGEYSLYVRATDPAGNTSNEQVITIDKDTLPPAEPVITEPVNYRTTLLDYVYVSGTAEPWTTVTITRAVYESIPEDVETINNLSADQLPFERVITLATDPAAKVENKITVTAADDLDLSSSVKELTVNYDPVLPTISANFNPNGSLYPEVTKNIEVTGQTNKLNATVSVIVYNGDTSKSSTVDVKGLSFSSNAVLTEGENTIHIQAIEELDGVRRVSNEVTHTVTLDATPPALTFIPALGTVTMDNSVFLNGSTEPQSIIKVTYGAYDNPANTVTLNSGSDGTISGYIPLLDNARNELVILATDQALNSATQTVYVTQDNNPPVVGSVLLKVYGINTVIAQGDTTNNSQFTLTGSVTDAAPGTVAALLKINNEERAITLTGGSFTETFTTNKEDENKLIITATDAAGRSTVNTLTFNRDTTPPVITAVNYNPNTTPTNVGSITVSGQTAANVVVRILRNNSVVSETNATAQGAFSVANIGLAPGANALVVKVSDSIGNTATSSVFSVAYDNTPPPLSVTYTPDKALVKDGTVNISGQTEANARVVITKNGTEVYNLVSVSGTFNYNASLIVGNNPITVVAIDAAGNSSVVSSKTINYDNAAPVISEVLHNAVRPLKAGETITVTVNGDSGATGHVTIGKYTLNLADQGNNRYEASYVVKSGDSLTNADVIATLADAAGNVATSTAVAKVTFDTVAPVLTTVSHNATQPLKDGDSFIVNVTGESGFTTGTVAIGSITLTLVEGAAGNYSASYTVQAGDNLNAALVTATLTDLAGNKSSKNAATSITIDTTVPAAPVVSYQPDADVTNNSTLELGINTESNAILKIYRNGNLVAETTTAVGSVVYGITLVQDVNRITVTATDAAGNTGTSSIEKVIKLDTAAPATPVVNYTPDQTTTNSATVAVWGTVEVGANVRIYLNGSVAWEVYAGDGSYSQVINLAEGASLIRVNALDAAGNVSSDSAERTITRDSVAPATPSVTYTPDKSDTNVATVTVSGTAETGAAVRIYRNGSVYEEVYATNGTYTKVVNLVEGDNLIKVNAVDAAGNVSADSAGKLIKLDITVPPVPVVSYSHDNAVTNSSTITVSITTEAAAWVRIYRNDSVFAEVYADATDAFFKVINLVEGENTIKIKVTDAAGNSTDSATRTVRLDTVLPAVPAVNYTPDNTVTNNSSVTVSATAEADAWIRIYLNGSVVNEAYATGGSFSRNVTLVEGDNTIRVKVTDAAGNSSDSATKLIKLDTIVPAVPVVNYTPDKAVTNVNTITVSGTAEADAWVRIYSGNTEVGETYATGGAFSKSVTLIVGDNNLKVKITDAAGNSIDSAIRLIKLDTAAPAVPTVSYTPDLEDSNVSTVTVSGTAEVDDRIRIYRNDNLLADLTATGGAFSRAISLVEGENSILVKVTDAAGNSTDSATKVIKLDTVAPANPAINYTPDSTITNNNTITVGGTAEADAWIRIYRNNVVVEEAYATGGSFSKSVPLVNGDNTIKVTVTDAAGNSTDSSSKVIKLDTAPPAVPTVSYTPDQALTTAGAITVSGTAEADAWVRIYRNNTVVAETYATDGVFNKGITLAEGDNTLIVKVTDAAGNSTDSAAKAIKLDSTAPVIISVSHNAVGNLIAGNTVTITVYSETGITTGVVNFGNISINNFNETEPGKYVFTYTALPTDNLRNATVTAVLTDLAGNSSSLSAGSITIDNQGPVITSVAHDAADAEILGLGSTVTITVNGDAGSTGQVWIGDLGPFTLNETVGQYVYTYTVLPGVNVINGRVVVTLTDVANNITSAAAATTITIDTQAPATPSVSFTPDKTDTNVSGITVSGIAEKDAWVRIYRGGSVIGEAYADDNGNYSANITLVEGNNLIAVNATDSAANTSSNSTGRLIKLDTASPGIPVINDGPERTNNASATISGSADVGSRVTIYRNGNVAGEVVASGGAFSMEIDLVEGDNHIVAKSTDVAGNVSSNSNERLISRDTTKPAAPVVSAIPALTSTGTITISGTAEIGSWVRIYRNGNVAGDVYATNGSFSKEITLVEGNNWIVANATDQALNVSVNSQEKLVVLDTEEPGVPVINPTPELINNNKVTISGSAEDGAWIRIYRGGSVIADAYAVDGGFTKEITLVEGNNQIVVNATDAAANVSDDSAVRLIKLDTIKPVVPGVNSLPDATNTGTIAVSGSAETGTTVRIYLDGNLAGEVIAEGGNYSKVITLNDGENRIVVNATDAANNTSDNSAVKLITLDTINPDVPVVNLPTTITNAATVTISGSAENNAWIRIYRGDTVIGEAYAVGGSYSADITLVDGANNITVSATDRAGNPSDLSDVYTINRDTAAPAAPVISYPADNSYINSTTVTITGQTDANGRVKFIVNGAELPANITETGSFTKTLILNEGANTVEVLVTDEAGNTGSSTTRTINVDTVAPGVPGVAYTPNVTPTNTNTVTVSGSAENNAWIQIYRNGAVAGAVYANANGNYSTTINLVEGNNQLVVKATDKAGNEGTGSEVKEITLDTQGPAVTTVSYNPNVTITRDSSVTVSGTSENNAWVRIYRNGNVAGDVYATNGSFSKEITLVEGNNWIVANATDQALNVSVNSQEKLVVLDTEEPGVPVINPTPELINNNKVTISGSAEDGAWIRIYRGGSVIADAYAVDGGFTKEITLVEGNNQIVVNATDAAANVSDDSAVRLIKLDTIKPVVPGVNSLPDATNTGTIAVSGSAETGTTVRIYLDGNLAGEVIAEGGNYSKVITLNDGENRIVVNATDAANNTSDNSAVKLITLDTINPDVPVVNLPTTITNAATVTISGSAENNAWIRIYRGDTVIGEAYAVGGSYSADITLVDGANNITVSATDRAGNPSDLSDVYTINRDTAAPAAPVISYPADNSYINSTTVTITGQTDANGRVKFIVNGAELPANITETGSFTKTLILNEGANTVEVLVTDEAGNTGSSTTRTINVDTVAPGVPGVAYTPNVTPTNTNTVTVSGSAENNAWIQIYRNGAVAGAVYANANGNYSTTINLVEGNNQLVVKATDKAGNEGTGSEVKEITLDTQGPAVTTVSYNPNVTITRDSSVTVSGTSENNAWVQIYRNGSVAGSAYATGGNYSTTITLVEGVNQIVVKATDTLGNEGAASVAKLITLDTAAQINPVTYNPSDASTTSSTINISGNTEGNAWVRIYRNGSVVGEVYADSKGDFAVTNIALEIATQTFKVWVRDSVGNEVYSTEHTVARTTSSSSGGTTTPAAQPPTTTPAADNAVSSQLSSTAPTVQVTLAAGQTGITLTNQTLVNTNEAKKDLAITTADKQLTLIVDPGALVTKEVADASKANKDVKVEVSAKEVSAAAVSTLVKENPAAKGYVSVGGKVFELEAKAIIDGTSSAIKTFSEPVKITISLADLVLNGIDPEKLGVFYLNEAKGTWDYVGGNVDKSKQTITVELNHFSKYTVMAVNRTFKDLNGHWAKQAIELMAAKEIIDGFPNGSFQPKSNITRAQFATMIVKALKLDSSSTATSFKDVKATDWHAGYVAAASKAGIIKGFNGSFNPDALITREEMAVMVIRALGLEAQAQQMAKTTLKFKDDTKISGWARGYVALEAQKDIVNGYQEDNTFRPQDKASRAEAAVTLSRFYSLLK